MVEGLVNERTPVCQLNDPKPLLRDQNEAMNVPKVELILLMGDSKNEVGVTLPL